MDKWRTSSLQHTMGDASGLSSCIPVITFCLSCVAAMHNTLLLSSDNQEGCWPPVPRPVKATHFGDDRFNAKRRKLLFGSFLPGQSLPTAIVTVTHCPHTHTHTHTRGRAHAREDRAASSGQAVPTGKRNRWTASTITKNNQRLLDRHPLRFRADERGLNNLASHFPPIFVCLLSRSLPSCIGRMFRNQV